MKISQFVAALSLALCTSAFAAELSLNAAGITDTVPSKLSSNALKASTNLESEPVQFAWRLEADAVLEAVSKPQQASSKE